MEVRSELARAAALLGLCRKELLDTGRTDAASCLREALRQIRRARCALEAEEEVSVDHADDPPELDIPPAEGPGQPASPRKARRQARRARKGRGE